jgi:hypothetical protein
MLQMRVGSYRQTSSRAFYKHLKILGLLLARGVLCVRKGSLSMAMVKSRSIVVTISAFFLEQLGYDFSLHPLIPYKPSTI